MEAENAKAVPLREVSRQVLLCDIGPETFGIEISHVQEVVETGPMRRIPKAPEFAVGMLNYHGRVIAVVDMAKFSNIEKEAREDNQVARVVVMEREGYNLGLRVDRAEQIVRLEGQGKAKSSGTGSQYIKEVVNVNGSAVNLLDIDKFLVEIEQYFA